MIVNFISNILELKKKESLVDPAAFNDPLALKIDWTPLAPGGASFRTHKAVMISTTRIEFKSTFLNLLFPLLALFVPLLILIAAYISGDLPFLLKPQTAKHYAMLASCILFVLAGVIVAWHVRKAIVFDRAANAFWKGRRRAQMVPGPEEIPNSVPLPDIYALQVIPEKIMGTGDHGSTYTSFELNLVRKSGERVNVIDHGNKKRLLEDAQMIAQFLNIPVWDAGPLEKDHLQEVSN
ncbi:MAG: hypothetical protein OEY44_01900 [Candidatus Peregrinibacteria bacterium]|nr:hypothetical protein [Candidatus Peregrinibacteria bacterium]